MKNYIKFAFVTLALSITFSSEANLSFKNCIIGHTESLVNLTYFYSRKINRLLRDLEKREFESIAQWEDYI